MRPSTFWAPKVAVAVEKEGGKGWIDIDQLTLEMWAMDGTLDFQSEMTSCKINRSAAKVVVAN